MTLIRRTNPFGETLSLRQAMDRLLEDSFARPRNGLLADEHAPALDVPRQIQIKATGRAGIDAAAPGTANATEQAADGE